MRLIDEKEALEKINEIPDRQMNGVTVAKALAQCKTIEAEPVRHGRWIYINGREYLGSHCSNCQKWYDYKHNYCPNCGTRMDGEC